MSDETAPTRPLYGEPWFTCPVTGLSTPRSKGIWRNGRLVNRLANDAPGYKEPPDTSEPPIEETDLGDPVIPYDESW